MRVLIKTALLLLGSMLGAADLWKLPLGGPRLAARRHLSVQAVGRIILVTVHVIPFLAAIGRTGGKPKVRCKLP